MKNIKKDLKICIPVIGVWINSKIFNYLFLFCSILILQNCKCQNIKHDSIGKYDKITHKDVVFSYFLDKDLLFSGEQYVLFYNNIKEKYKDTSGGGYILSFVLTFVVDKNGKVIGARLEDKKEGEYTREEMQIVKIVNSSPKLEPGIYLGKKVNSYVTIRFKAGINENGEIERF